LTLKGNRKVYSKRLFLVCLTTIFIYGGFLILRAARPWYLVWQLEISDEQDSTHQNAIVAQLIAEGPRSLAPTISAIQQHSPFSKSTYRLTDVLKGVGRPARTELLRAINQNRNPLRKGHLIYCLQHVFADYSKINQWIRLLRRSPTDHQLIEQTLREHFGPDVPPVLNDSGAINPEFLRWYDITAKCSGKLPKREF